ncbi:MAG: hypothetical protein ABH824_06925 [Nanoarchaeota archaeon]|nr:hypothetical protein [Nanoarchaeota archaeon]MBU1631964.1 hypothetical protein [Nanoarchaeota archaeon]MBU1876421.1 hypothetical protein [Nanoarchaeota archaeon]
MRYNTNRDIGKEGNIVSLLGQTRPKKDAAAIQSNENESSGLGKVIYLVGPRPEIDYTALNSDGSLRRDQTEIAIDYFINLNNQAMDFLGNPSTLKLAQIAFNEIDSFIAYLRKESTKQI